MVPSASSYGRHPAQSAHPRDGAAVGPLPHSPVSLEGQDHLSAGGDGRHLINGRLDRGGVDAVAPGVDRAVIPQGGGKILPRRHRYGGDSLYRRGISDLSHIAAQPELSGGIVSPDQYGAVLLHCQGMGLAPGGQGVGPVGPGGPDRQQGEQQQQRQDQRQSPFAFHIPFLFSL